MKHRNKIILIIALVIGLGIFLRSYNFSDWIHFELDQSRDARIVVKAVEDGIGNLPLQGPRAAGSFLRLGPAFYYLEYIGAKFFGTTPAGIASGILILSILTLPIFYFFVRRYFNTRISIGLLAIFSTSLFLIMYSRFAWNPNPIPFFMLLSAYALLRVVDGERERRNFWLMVFAFALAVGTQLHFLVFMILPTISAIFLLIKRPRLKIWAWATSFLIVLFVYSPMIINDVKTGGENVKEFFSAVTKKSDKNDHSLIEKAIKNYTEHSIGHLLVISGQEQAELPGFEIGKKIKKPIDAKCDYDCRQNLPLGIVAFLYFTVGIALLVRNLFIHKNGIKRDFLVVSVVWMAVSFLIMTPLSYDIAPRFFLVTAPIAFVFAGLILELLDKTLKKRWISTVIIIMLVISNLLVVQKRFSEMARASTENVEIEPDRILKERSRFTYEQQEMIVDYLEQFHKENGYPIYLQSEPFYTRSFIFSLERRKIRQDVLAVNKVYVEGNYFMILRTSGNSENRLGKYSQSYDVVEEKQFGTMIVFRLAPKNEAITAERQVFEVKKADCKTSSDVQKRYTWNEIFKTGECFIENDEEDGEDVNED